MKRYNGTGYPNGFDPQTKKPLDVRLVVDTLADRNRLEYTYPSMPVTVLGPVVVSAGVDTYPQMSHWRCLVDRQPTYGGPTTFDADWIRDDAPATLTAGGYKGPWDAQANVPDLTDQVLLASLQAGAFYKVSVAGSSNLSNITSWAVNDSVFWDGFRWDKFENTNPLPVNPLYADTQGAQFQADVLNLIRLNSLTEWQSGKDFGVNAYVKSSYSIGNKAHVDTYVAVGAMTAATAALPTTATPNPNWQLVTTTNIAQLGQLENGDNVGMAATGANKPSKPTIGKALSPEETDARIKQFGTVGLSVDVIYPFLEAGVGIYISKTGKNTILISTERPTTSGNLYAKPGYMNSDYAQ